MKIDKNEKCKNLQPEIKEFINYFYKNEEEGYLENHANLEDFMVDIGGMDTETLLNYIILFVNHSKKELLFEILNDLKIEQIYDKNVGPDYINACEHTIDRITVHLQKKLIKEL